MADFLEKIYAFCFGIGKWRLEIFKRQVKLSKSHVFVALFILISIFIIRFSEVIRDLILWGSVQNLHELYIARPGWSSSNKVKRNESSGIAGFCSQGKFQSIQWVRGWRRSGSSSLNKKGITTDLSIWAVFCYPFVPKGTHNWKLIVSVLVRM